MFNKIIILLALVGISVLIFQIEVEQKRKAKNALIIIQTCPSGANLMIEASTPVFGEGLKATCIYNIGQITFRAEPMKTKASKQ